jgi:hypothetical protein
VLVFELLWGPRAFPDFQGIWLSSLGTPEEVPGEASGPQVVRGGRPVVGGGLGFRTCPAESPAIERAAPTEQPGGADNLAMAQP